MQLQILQDTGNQLKINSKWGKEGSQKERSSVKGGRNGGRGKVDNSGTRNVLSTHTNFGTIRGHESDM